MWIVQALPQHEHDCFAICHLQSHLRASCVAREAGRIEAAARHALDAILAAQIAEYDDKELTGFLTNFLQLYTFLCSVSGILFLLLLFVKTFLPRFSFLSRYPDNSHTLTPLLIVCVNMFTRNIITQYYMFDLWK